MHCKLLKNQSRRIASPLLGLAICTGLAMGAETPGIRISAPSLAWVLSSDGTQLIEISGVTDSPRQGRNITLPSAARQSWASPDAASSILRLDEGLFVLRASEEIRQIAELPTGTSVSAAWDRGGAAFVICFDSKCESRAADGAIRSSWETESNSRILAYSAESGLVIAGAGSVLWLRGDDRTALDPIPVAATFRPGADDLWLLDGEGHLSRRNFAGGATEEGNLVANALGLLSSRDGKLIFAANADGEAASFSFETMQTERLSIGETVEGLWLAPGPFSVRLHESAKRPIAIWSGESGLIGWMPAQLAEIEVRQ